MTKLCPRGKAAAKRKFKVYPSAYANAYASKICAGKIKDPSGTKRKDWGPKKASEGEFIKKPQPPLRNKKNIRRSLSPREIEYQKKKKAYDTLTGNENKRPRPKKFKKGKAIMIVIGIGKKKKVDKKMGGGMTAGSMSGMGRLQKARMMNKGDMAETIEKAKEYRKRAKQKKRKKGFELKYPGPARPGNPVVVYEVKKGGLTSELNNPAKGYTKGGMADYYKDLM